MSEQGIKTSQQLMRNFNDVGGGAVWAIRYGAEPTDAHIADRILGLPELDKKLNDIFHGGVMSAGNHLYVEIGRLDEQGKFNTLKRIHGYSVKDTEDGTKLATEPEGKIFTMVIDGKHTPFSDDPIYQMDPHESRPNQLQSATDSFIFGEDATQIVFRGTQYEVMVLYSGLLEATIKLNNENMPYNAFQVSAPNGNSTHEALRGVLVEMAEKMGVGKIGDHDASGLDHFPWGEKLEIPETSDVKIFECAPLEDIMARVESLEQTAAQQWAAVRDLGEKAEFDQTLPEAGLTGCHNNIGPKF